MPTGIAGLDEVLLGGLNDGNMVLIEGAPGTGKTTLGLEFIYRGIAEHDIPGVIVTFELSPEKLMRDARGFGFDLARLQADGRLRIIYSSPAVILQELQSHDGLLLTELQRLGAGRVLIDGLTPMRLFTESTNGRSFRDALHLLLETLQVQKATAMLTGETAAVADALPTMSSHEQFLCDTVITLRHRSRGRGTIRDLEVCKSRGQDFISGKHTLRIEPGRGVAVYCRAEARPRTILDQPTSQRRTGLGVPALDALFGEGIYDGSVTLVVGVTGTGKTVIGTQFLVEGARLGKKCLLVTLDEHPEQIMRNAAGLELGLKEAVVAGRILIHYDSPQELELDVHFQRVLEIIDEHKIERVLIDSLGAYKTNYVERKSFHDFVYAMTSSLKNRLVTTFLNYESPELLGLSQISEDLRASTIVDNIVLLNYVEFSNRLRRAITVPKARGSAPTRETHEYVIRQGGIDLLPGDGNGQTVQVPQLPFASYYGVLARSPARESPAITEQVKHGVPVADEVPREEALVAEDPPVTPRRKSKQTPSSPAGRASGRPAGRGKRRR